MNKLEAMSAFVKVVALGNYAEAGRTLGVTRSAVSKAVLELERLLGARLLDRTTRRVRPTEAGLAYYGSCVDILARVEETELQVSRLHDEPKGVLKINGPMSFGVMHLGPAIAAFMEAYPELKIELTLNDRFIDPIEEGVDVTIRIAALADSSLIARKLAPVRRVVAAAPAYLEKYGVPADPGDLLQHRCLHYGGLSTMHRWQLTRNGQPINVSVNAIMSYNNGDVLLAAALAGQGVVLLPTFMAGPHIEAGHLKVVLNDFQVTEAGIYALYAANRYLAAKTRVLIDFLSKRFGATPSWDVF